METMATKKVKQLTYSEVSKADSGLSVIPPWSPTLWIFLDVSGVQAAWRWWRSSPLEEPGSCLIDAALYLGSSDLSSHH